MKKNILLFIMTIFFIVGLVFFVVGICIFIFESNIEKVEITGVIERIENYRNRDGDISHKVYVQYEIDGEEYYSELGTYTSSYYEGKEIDMYYDKNNPERIGTKDNIILPIIFLGMGILFLSISGSSFVYGISKNRRNQKLKTTGYLIHAEYEKVTLNAYYTLNGMHPYKIICSWINSEDSQKYIFKSQNLWTNPENIISEKQIKTFPVYIDPKKPSKYYMDVEILEKNNVIEENSAIKYN